MARSKKQIWYFDLQKIERDDAPLNATELKVKAQLAHDPRAHVELKLMLEEAMQQLTPNQRHTLQLRLDGYTLAEIARQLQVSIPVVHETLGAAQRRLRKLLGETSS